MADQLNGLLDNLEKLHEQTQLTRERQKWCNYCWRNRQMKPYLQDGRLIFTCPKCDKRWGERIEP